MNGHRMKAQCWRDRSKKHGRHDVALQFTNDNPNTRHPIELGDQNARSLIIEVVQDL